MQYADVADMQILAGNVLVPVAKKLNELYDRDEFKPVNLIFIPRISPYSLKAKYPLPADGSLHKAAAIINVASTGRMIQ